MVPYLRAAALIAEIYQTNPNTKFVFKHEKAPTLTIQFVYWVVSFLGFFYAPIKTWFFEQSTSVIGDYVLFGSKKHNVDCHFMPRETYLILRHELVHMKQRKTNRLWEARYLFCLPLFYTERAKWELEAYKETLKATHEIDGFVSSSQIYRIVDLFVSYKYFFMSAPWHRIAIGKELTDFARALNKNTH